MHQVASEELGNPGRVAALSGPNHAEEICLHKISAAVVASEDLHTSEYFQSLLVCPSFRVYVSDDICGIETCAAVKNVVAIACGIAVGLGAGDNTLAVLMLACGDIGEGKLASVETIASAALGILDGRSHDLAGRSIVVTAGPTHEAIDPVRYIANASTGKMGYAIAARAAARGARVTLVSGPTSLQTPVGVRLVSVVSAAQMYDATTVAFGEADAAICAAAVADYTPANPADHKLKKAEERLTSIELVETRDILAALCSSRAANQVVVGFAAETDDLIANARRKLACILCLREDGGRGGERRHVHSRRRRHHRHHRRHRLRQVHTREPRGAPLRRYRRIGAGLWHRREEVPSRAASRPRRDSPAAGVSHLGDHPSESLLA